MEILRKLRVVLVRPQFPENIGAAARAVANMGLGGLHLVEPMRPWDEPMRRLATGGGAGVLDAMVTHESLAQALGDCAGAIAFTARKGRDRGVLLNAENALSHALELTSGGTVALVFGPEDRGLTTSQLVACTISAYILTTEHSSLNLAQAVVVASYQARLAAMVRGQKAGTVNSPGPPADMGQMALLHQRLRQALVTLGVVPGDNPEHFYRPFKSVLDRARPSPKEVRAWHGIARQVAWLAGLAKKPKQD